MLIQALDADEITSAMTNPFSATIPWCSNWTVDTLCNDHPRQDENVRISKRIRWHGHRRATSRRLVYEIDGAAAMLPAIRHTFSDSGVGTEGLFRVEIRLVE